MGFSRGFEAAGASRRGADRGHRLALGGALEEGQARSAATSRSTTRCWPSSRPTSRRRKITLHGRGASGPTARRSRRAHPGGGAAAGLRRGRGAAAHARLGPAGAEGPGAGRRRAEPAAARPGGVHRGARSRGTPRRRPTSPQPTQRPARSRAATAFPMLRWGIVVSAAGAAGRLPMTDSDRRCAASASTT